MRPTAKQINAVRAVLYKHDRLRTIDDHTTSIVHLMNLDPSASLPSTARPAGQGPLWYIPATRALSPTVVEAAARLDKIAALILQMREELAGVDFNSADKANLRAALAAQADGLRLRARVWRDPAKPGDPQALAETIVGHEAEALRRLKILLLLHMQAEREVKPLNLKGHRRFLHPCNG